MIQILLFTWSCFEESWLDEETLEAVSEEAVEEVVGEAVELNEEDIEEEPNTGW